MVSLHIIQEEPRSEEWGLTVNGKSFELRIEKSPEGPVFSFRDEGVKLLPHEQEAVLAEMRDLKMSFEARRAFGTFVPATRRKKFQKK